MKYEYRCKQCYETHLLHTYGLEGSICTVCGDGILARVYSITVHRDLPEHYNPQVGKPIRGMQQLKRELRDAGEKQWEKTGIPHRYVPMDMRELPQPAEAREEADRKSLDKHWRDAKFIAPVTK